MNRFKKVIGVAILATVIATVGIASIASAQTATPPATPTAPTAPGGPGGHPGFGGGGLRGQAELEAAAKALGMTADELSAQLWGGKTLADIAAAKGVDIATVKAAVEAAQIAETKTAINQAVTDGTITQAKADWLLEGLDKGYWGAGTQGNFGFGMGPGMDHGGPRGFGGPNGAPPSGVAPNSSGTTTPSNNN